MPSNMRLNKAPMRPRNLKNSHRNRDKAQQDATRADLVKKMRAKIQARGQNAD